MNCNPRCIFLALFVFATPIIAHAGDALGYSGKIWMPDFIKSIPKDQVVTSATLHLDCVAIEGIGGVPDGWSVSVTPAAETYLVGFSRPLSDWWKKRIAEVGIEAVNRDAAGMFVKLRFRGQWSDCAGWDLIVTTESVLAGKPKQEFHFVDAATIVAVGQTEASNHEWRLAPENEAAKKP